ncbi:MAG: S-adenosyl-l-methionine hydroxide adenosyltransferase family protein [Promethearchaeota archaeon]
MIVLLTDFGESEFVGMMKGAILSINPDIQVLDLTHSITPQSVREGAWVLLQSYKAFPKGAIFVCVVDPGVGTARNAVHVKTENYSFIGPDNGLMYPAASSDEIRIVNVLRIDKEAAPTFHGRDVFAKAAGFLSIGALSNRIVKSKSELDVPLEFRLDGREGEVVRIDRFGNIVTNIPPTKDSQIHIVTDELDRVIAQCKTYSDGPDDDIFAITGSAGTLEISKKNGSAIDDVEVAVGHRILLE